ncbi:uncharacterized protein si:ch211-197l9.2 [Cololabis saira]|uniref:uncharacterized protein si:ch211-197l9.2 n=1 Tax=Cololabis saira TaxID=129043 RepID=UPI002AD53CA7|nr:uncharacterized protein si:ch211-197l9.2 [Cololabis saira]
MQNMNKEGEKSSKTSLRSQKQPKTHQQVLVQKKKKNLSSKDAQRGVLTRETRSDQWQQPAEPLKPAGQQDRRAGKASPGDRCQSQGSPGAQRKLSDASNASEDLSKDSGCPSGKLSSSESSSEISDCVSEGNKRESPGTDNELSWIEGRAYVSPEDGGAPAAPPAARTCAPPPRAAGAGLGLLNLPGAIMDLMMGESTEDLVREMEDLRSENEYLKDEVEELRCEMLEMRDMFQEEEVYQLQELRMQLEQANKTCRILAYRLRKAERRSIRVAQTGHVDGELVRSLEHDIKVAKSVSLRLYNELEAVQKKNSQLEWDNEVLREKTQELDVAKQVLQTEVDKARESSLKKRNNRSTTSKAEKRLSQLIEDDSADLKCQLHFAKEELALMCKKLTKLVSESEAMREELAKYQMTYGEIDAAQPPEGKQKSGRAREAEVKVHLKLVEEEATLLSRRIVELEVENRGLRAEMSDLREKVGGGGGEEEDALEENPSATVAMKDREGDLKMEPGVHHNEQSNELEKGKGEAERPLLCSQSQNEGMVAVRHMTREGPVGGEWESSDSRESDGNRKPTSGPKGMTLQDYETLLALRDHSCILTSAIQLLNTAPRNGHSPPPSGALSSQENVSSNGKALRSLNEALELLQAMLLAFIGRMEAILRGVEGCKNSAHKDGDAWDSVSFLSVNHENIQESPIQQEHIEDIRATEVKKKEKQVRQGDVDGCRDPQMILSLKILWILHQACNVKGPEREGKEVRHKALSVLLELLQDLGGELRGDSKARAPACDAAECAVGDVLHEGHREPLRTCSMEGERLGRSFWPGGWRRKNWCYLSQEAAQVDREDPVKTWDHPIMPFNFPDLDFEQMSMERSNTAPERSTFRIYYSPPSARRVQLAQLKQSPVANRTESVDTSSPWCTPPTSFSQICLGSSANLSDDMKEMTAGWRQTVHGGSQEKRGKPAGRWVDVACSGTQTHMKPQMVSVAQQTDGTQSTVRNSPSRVLSSSLVSARSQHMSTSLDGIPGRVERARVSTSSPKLYRRHSSLPSSTSLSSSSSSSTSTSRDRAAWNLPSQSYSGLTWARQASPRSGSGQNHGSVSSAKPPNKSAGTNRCGLVTEFLRRVSGRADKAGPESGQKGKRGLKNLERAPARPAAAPLHRNDSVTRIVNQRFMKQREEPGRAPREEKGSGPNPRVRNSHSSATTEDGNYDCSSSSTLTFCFARPSRSGQKQTSIPGKLHRPSPAASTAADSSCG